MRRHFIAAALMLVAVSSCKKKDETTPANNTPTTTGQQFACKIDGKEYAPNNGRFYSFPTGTGFQIVGDTATYTIELYIPSTSTGTITLGNESTQNKFATVFFNDGNKHYISTEGEINITKSDGTKMSGTFHYKAKDTNGNTVDVTNGEFNDIEKKN